MAVLLLLSGPQAGSRQELTDREADGELSTSPVKELIPAVGPVAGLYNSGVALLSARSEAMVLRRAAEELPGASTRRRRRRCWAAPRGCSRLPWSARTRWRCRAR